jgi:hypothetical protein
MLPLLLPLLLLLATPLLLVLLLLPLLLALLLVLLPLLLELLLWATLALSVELAPRLSLPPPPHATKVSAIMLMRTIRVRHDMSLVLQQNWYAIEPAYSRGRTRTKACPAVVFD